MDKDINTNYSLFSCMKEVPDPRKPYNKSIASVTITQQAGRAVASGIIKSIPGIGTIVGGIIGATTAAGLTETLGWIVADDFYRMSQGKDPENIIENAGELKSAFDGLRMSK